jgi:hypothetical protein
VVDFDSFYEGAPPWDIDRPQKEFVQLEEAGEIVGSYLMSDAGLEKTRCFLQVKGIPYRE